MTKPLPRCPECRKVFKTVQLLAMHRKKLHNVEGTSASHLAAKALKTKRAEEAITAPLMQLPDAIPVALLCPECSVGFTTPQQLGRHRKLEHGVQSVVDRKREARLNLDGGLPCPHCDFVAVNKAGFSLHINKQHAEKSEGVTLEQQSTQATRAIVHTNGSAQLIKTERQADSDGIPEATLALALGRFQGLCASMANEFDLPPRRFARELSRLIYAAQVR